MRAVRRHRLADEVVWLLTVVPQQRGRNKAYVSGPSAGQGGGGSTRPAAEAARSGARPQSA